MKEIKNKNIDIKDIPTICELIDYLLDMIFGDCSKNSKPDKDDQKKYTQKSKIYP